MNPLKLLRASKLTDVLWRYGFACVLVAAALGFSLGLQWWTHARLLFPFFAAILTAGYFCGRGPAWLAVVLTLLAADYYFAPPLYDFEVGEINEGFYVPFVVAALIAGCWSSLARPAKSWTAVADTERPEAQQEVVSNTAI